MNNIDKIFWTSGKRKVSELISLNSNPRKWNKDGRNKLDSSVTKFNVATAFTINTDNTIIGGNFKHNLLIENGRGDEDVNVLVPNRMLNQKEVEELAVKLNISLGDWDTDKLIDLFEKDDLLDFGFGTDELDFFSEKETKGDDDLHPLSKDIITKYADEWELNNHRLKCGDSTNEFDVKRLMNEQEYKLLFSSPPYNMNAGLYVDYKDNLSNEEFVKFNLLVLMLYKKYISAAGFVFWNMSYNKNSGASFIEVFYNFVKNTGLHFLEDIVWDKGHGLPITGKLTRQYEHVLVMDESINDIHFIDHIGVFGSKDVPFIKSGKKAITNYWKIDSNGSQSADFKASFPVDLPLRAINLCTISGDIIVDPFCGQGTTLIAAEKSNRICYTIELSPEYCDLTITRYIHFCTANNRPIVLKCNGKLIDHKLFINDNSSNK